MQLAGSGRGERGQALAEVVLFLPLLLLALFGTIYIVQYGVLAERTELAVRFSGTSGAQQSALYSAASMYTELESGSAGSSCPSPAAGVLTGSSPLPGPSTPPFFAPAGSSSTCSIVTTSLPGANFIAIFLEQQDVTMTTNVAIPAYLRSVLGSTATAKGAMDFVRAADPQTIMYCISTVQQDVNASLNVGNLPTPPPGGTSQISCN